jgi:hypothetical protein
LRPKRAKLRPYAVPERLLHNVPEQSTRRADKTGLISWQANKYSVPMAWQQSSVGVREQAGSLHIHDLETGEHIATHALCLEKGRLVKNTHHYRDPAQRIAELERAIVQCLPDGEGEKLCRLLKATSPKIYKDQLVGVRDLLRQHGAVEADLVAVLTQQIRLTASAVERYLEAWRQAQRRGRQPDDTEEPDSGSQMPSCALRAYARVGQSTGQEVTHEPA